VCRDLQAIVDYDEWTMMNRTATSARASSHVLYLFSVVESTEPKQVYSCKLGFVSERTIKDIIIIYGAVVGGQSVFQRSLSLLVRWVAAWGCCGGRSEAWVSSGRVPLQQLCWFTAV
jgi:hypothetical protein